MKELGSNAELKAKELHDAKVAEQNKMVHCTASDHAKDIEANPEIAIRVPDALKEYQMEHGSQEEEVSQIAILMVSGGQQYWKEHKYSRWQMTEIASSDPSLTNWIMIMELGTNTFVIKSPTSFAEMVTSSRIYF